MSEQAFHVGDAVEVRPAPEGAAGDWRRVSGLHGVVRRVRRVRDLPVDVQFPGFEGGHRLDSGLLPFDSSEGWNCDPAWLRLVTRGPRNLGASEAGRTQSATSVYSEGTAGATLGGREVILGSTPCDVCGEVVTLLPGQRMFELCSRCFQRLPPPSPDAPSRPQDARSGPSVAKPDSQGAPGGTGAATWNVLYTTNIPRFKEGDAVRYRGDAHRRHVVEVSLTPRYRLDGGDAWVREEDLRRVWKTWG